MMNRLTIGTLLICCLLLSSCGWHLRGWHNSGNVESIELIAKDRYAPLSIAMINAMQRSRIQNSADASLRLYLGDEVLSKRTVAVTSIGSPAQYELSLSVDFRYIQAGDSSNTPFLRSTAFRVFDFDPSNTVAKTEEENTLLSEMRRELAHRILSKHPN